MVIELHERQQYTLNGMPEIITPDEHFMPIDSKLAQVSSFMFAHDVVVDAVVDVDVVVEVVVDVVVWELHALQQ